MFFGILGIGAILIVITVLVHAVILERMIVSLKSAAFEYWINQIIPASFRKMFIITFAVLGTFLSHVIQIWIWALFYLFVVGAITDLESALYFSTSAFTTVGFGDVVLDKDWRLLSTFQAAGGFLMFSWSAAFIFEVMFRLYEPRSFRGE